MNSKYTNNSNKHIIAGLDIGTNKICSVISTTDQNGHAQILGSATVPSRGIRKGVVVNLEQAALAIIAAIEKAELQASLTVNSVILGVSGGHIESTQSKGAIAINNKEITEDDIKRVIDTATTIIIPPDREIIHVLPLSFSVDNEHDIKDPLGMTGSRLEIHVHIITVAATSVSNLIKSVYKAGFETSDIVLKSLAASKAILSEEEKEEGCILIDIGSATTNFVIFMDGGMRHTGQLSIGGAHITHDIAYGMKTTVHIAEQIKCDFGSAIASVIPIKEQIEIPVSYGRSDRWESRRILAEIIQPRLEEILFLVHEEIEKTGLKNHLSGGIILTGGVAFTENIADLAAEIFHLPTRIGRSLKIKGLNEYTNNPSLSTAIGLSLYGLNETPKLGSMSRTDEEKNFQNIVHRIQDWFNEFF